MVKEKESPPCFLEQAAGHVICEHAGRLGGRGVDDEGLIAALLKGHDPRQPLDDQGPSLPSARARGAKTQRALAHMRTAYPVAYMSGATQNPAS